MATLYTRTIGSVTYNGETITLKLVCTYTQATSDNASNVSIYVRVESGDIFNKVESWQITGNGPTGSGGETSSSKATRDLTSKTKKISHLLNGSQTFSSGAKVTLKYMTGGGWATQNFTLSNVSYSLPTINVYPSISFSPASPYMSSTVTMNITKPSTSAFTATGVKIVASYDGTDVTVYEGTGASTTWSIPDLASTTPNSETKAITIKVQSIRDGVYYSAKDYTLNAQVPAAYVPSCAFDTITDNYNFSAFIVGYSLLNVAVKSGTAGTGASIASYTIEMRETNYQGGVIYTATNTTTAATTTFAIPIPIITTTTYIKVTITDSRGRTGHVSRNVSAVAYQKPQISLTAERCDSGGTADPMGAYAKVVCTWSITQISTDNQVNGTINIKKSTNGISYSNIKSETISPNVYSGSFYVVTSLATTAQGWFYASMADNVSSAESSIKMLPRAVLPIAIYDNGNDVGVSIGQMTKSKGVHVYLDMEHRNHSVIPNISVSSANGYAVIATFEIVGAYADQPIFMKLVKRNTAKPVDVAIAWNQENSTDPALNQLSATGEISNLYIYKKATSKWQLLFKHTSGSENFAVLDLQMGSRMTTRVEIDWTTSDYASLPGTLNTDVFQAVQW